MNLIYPKYKEALLNGDSDAPVMTNEIKVVLVDTGVYTFDSAHEFKSDLSGIVSESVNSIGNKSVTNGVFSGEQVLFQDVVGTTTEAIVIFVNNTLDTNSRLVAYFDQSTGLPLTPNGSDITARWETDIFRL